MLKGIVTGTLIGAAVTVAVLKLRDARAAEKPAAGASAAAEDLDALRRETADLRARNAAAQKELEAAEAAARAAAAPEEKPGKKKKGKAARGTPTWKELAPKLRKAFLAMAAKPGENDPDADANRAEMEMAMLGMMSLLGKIAKERGITVDEAMLSPEGLPQLLMALLDTSDAPPGEDQRRSFQALLDRYGAGWTEANAGGTRLEKRLAVQGVQHEFLDAFRGAMTPAQLDALGGGEIFGDMNFRFGGGNTWTGGSREEVASSLTSMWTKTLKLDDSRADAVRPIVEEYMAACREANTPAGGSPEAARRASADQAQARLRAQIAAQRRLAALAVTPEQKKALDNWSVEYNFNEWENAPTPVPEGAEK